MRPILALVLSLSVTACPGESGTIPKRDGPPSGEGIIRKDGPQADTPIPTTCGNKTKEAGEECDDGNQDNTDDCLSNCKLAFCGDGQVHKSVEECDDGNQDNNDACSVTCRSQGFQANSISVKDQRYPAVAIQSSGMILVVWQDASATGSDSSGTTVRMRRFDLKGKALDGSEVIVPTTTGDDQRDPDVAIDGQDQALVVWTDWSKTGGDASATGVRGRMISKAGAPSGQDFLVNSTTTGPQAAPAACASAGGFVVAYNDTSIGGSKHGTDIRMRQVGPGGQPSGSDKQVNTANQGDQMWADCAAVPGGNVLIVWQTWSNEDKDSKDIGIGGRVYNSSGSTVTGELLINAITAGRQENPTVTTDGSQFVVAWEDESKAGSDKDADGIQLRWFSSSGQGSGQEQVANTTTTGAQRNPAIDAHNGRIALVWEDASQPGQGLDIRSRRYQGQSPSDATDQLTNTSTQLDQARPAVAVGPGGEMVVVWESTGSLGDNDGYGIRMRIIGP